MNIYMIIPIVIYLFLGHAINRLADKAEGCNESEIFKFVDLIFWLPMFMVVTFHQYYITFIKKKDGT